MDKGYKGPLAYVAAQLGHADNRMVGRYYWHLAPPAMAEAIRKSAPSLGVDQSEVDKLCSTSLDANI